ncbi:MAG: PfkB family carbohydrate kinase [Eubacteriales bacterium]|nr:PfkB family carbohydrate kinase [Eubacteriales bacterium]
MHEIYLYGSILTTDSFILDGEYPKNNGYGEFTEHHTHIGGETGVAMAILASYGIRVKGTGYDQGMVTGPILKDYFKNTNADLSALTFRDDFEGFHDYVFIDRANNTRTSFGPFGTLPKQLESYYAIPKEEDIANAKVISIDPFQEGGSLLAAQYAVKHAKPYVTIDCPHDSYFAKNCSVAIISNDFIQNEYPDAVPEKLMEKYMEGSDALYIFTYGGDTVYYGRSGIIKTMSPYKIKAMSTLGAGDSFRTGCVYGLYKMMSDDELVDFACAMAACACQVYPLAKHLPTLEAIRDMQKRRA